MSSKFPAPVYSETVLTPCFNEAKLHFLEPLLALHEAHALMLERQGILSREDARTLLKAIGELNREKLRSANYDGSFEDFFFLIEKALTDPVGDEIAGKLHTARSRNDIDITLYRMILRQDLLTAIETGTELTESLLQLARNHLSTVMPAHTHTQPAQPTTLAHYLGAAIDFLRRDLARLRSAYVTVNQNPLGACAITTTGFPIDRQDTTALLGFDGVIENSYGAIANFDYSAEALSALATAMLNLGRFNQDLLLWATQEFSFIRIGDAFVQKSSIMPQKRNPVALEHVRILASRSMTSALAAIQSVHNTPMGDINDVEDPIQPVLREAFSSGVRAMKLLAGVVGAISVDAERLKQLASGSYLTLTELADTLVREECLSFREAHRLCSATIQKLGATAHQPAPEKIIEALQVIAADRLNRPLRTRHSILLASLDPVNFVEVRKVTGGPAPETMRTYLDKIEVELADAKQWLNSARARLARAEAERARRITDVKELKNG